MIKAGDKVKFKKYDETIYTVVNIEDEHVRVINSTGTQLMQVRKDFIDVVEQSIDYKQRADELEKQNNMLNYNIRAELDAKSNIYIAMNEEKLRADELEKRWNELVDVLKKKYEYYKVRADDESAGPIEQGKWKIAKHELMMVLKIMTDLNRGEIE
ncbi:hypothetical protein QNJ24_07945 [Macrococcus caseolyticus]|uniref:hypothetical protein n=1 Tax=Macrococcoides caseolyticum TaxID=69966 RepID=UPI0024BBF1B2|nr:hypothetical protein [Macrococcus caseolyticus]MDJ1156041.1 hypothetical protein [Macrococcus caseolyticus]